MQRITCFLRGLVPAAALFLVSGANIALAQDKDLVLRGDAICTVCHDQNSGNVLAIGQRRHGVKGDARTPTCTTCHGPSEEHRQAPTEKHPDKVYKGHNKSQGQTLNGSCLGCHESGKRTHWQGSRHESSGLTCSNCHTVHAAVDAVQVKASQPDVCFNCHKTQRSEAQRISHHPVLEGKVACSDCHNPHGSAAPKNLAKNSVNETCFQCHAEKRGPFLWEHASVTDDCMNCHTPHGSTNQGLLRAKMPWLCQECHGDGAPHPGNVYSGASLPGGRVANINNTGGVSGNTQLGVVNPTTGARVTQNAPPAQLAFRGCVNCHSQVHGSNHPAGNRFMR